MEKLTELLNLRASVEMGGGKEKVEEQHKLGKKTARERIAALIDEGTFVETNAFVCKKCSEYDMENAYADGVVTGYGAIDGRPVAVFSQDATIMGGSIGEMHAQKIAKTIENSVKTGVPVIGFTDCSGVRLQEGLDALEGIGKILSNMSDASGVVPMINIVSGKLAGVAISPEENKLNLIFVNRNSSEATINLNLNGNYKIYSELVLKSIAGNTVPSLKRKV